MNEFLIIFYIIENIYFVYKTYKQPDGIFSPVFIFSMMCLGQLLPQLTTIYFLQKIYPPYIIPPLVITMIFCNAAFYVGWNKCCKVPKNINILDIKPIYLKFLTILFCACAVIFTQIIKAEENSDSFDGVIAFQFQGVGIIGIILAILYVIKCPHSKIVIISLIVATLSILEYSLTIYGSRQSLFTIALLYAYLVTKKKWIEYHLVKKIMLVFLIVGFIGSLSIVEVRNSINSEKGYLSDFNKIDFITNISKSFENSYNPLSGMDLGNAALCIQNCQETGRYNYGLFLWDGFVFNYVPRRIFGQDFKDALTYDVKGNAYVAEVTHGITCTTGYYDAFSSLWYFGFIIFYILARLFKFFYVRRNQSLFMEMIFLFVLVNSSVAVTHGLQLVFAKFEFVAILFILLFFTLKRYKVKCLKK